MAFMILWNAVTSGAMVSAVYTVSNRSSASSSAIFLLTAGVIIRLDIVTYGECFFGGDLIRTEQ